MAALVALPLLAAAGGVFKVDPTTGRVVDGEGRERLFHGVNAVEKVVPWIVDFENCNRNNSLCPEDADKLAGWGLNVVRLGVLWAGTHPTARGDVNATYLEQVRKVIDMLEAHNIYTIVDMHQDVLHERTCGEGLPTWAYLMILDSVGFDINDPKKKFPKPLPFSLDFDSKTGYPTIPTCLNHAFAEYYLSHESEAAWKAIYTRPVVWDIMAEHWGAVAKALSDSTGVIGYEFLNEPWPSSTNGSFISLSDSKSLLPLYKRCAAEVRKYDDNHIVMFEPIVLESYEEIISVTTDFPEYGIEGADYADRQLFAYHSYCSNNKAGTPSPMWLCKLLLHAGWAGVERNLKHLKLGGFLTEWGAAADDADSIELMHIQGGYADSQLQSWAYWTYRSFDDITTQNGATETFYNPDGSLQMAKVKALSRTYAQATAGNILSMKFDETSGAFSLSYNVSGTATAPTEVFVSEFYFPQNGTAYTVAVSPKGAATTALDPKRRGILVITHANTTAPGTVLTVTLTP